MADPLDQAEETVAEEVSAVLEEVADEFARHVEDATELVAARFSVSQIARMFADRMPRIVRRLLGVSEQAANEAADDVGGELPPEWQDLPGRYDDGRPLPPVMSGYVTTTEHTLRAVGDRLAEVARQELAAGIDAGEDIDRLRARLRAAFAREGAQLGDDREERIASTEAGRAWNTATLGAARDAAGPDKPLVKQWISRGDSRVRRDHKAANGQIRLIDEPFTVGGVHMDAPHDPAAPASQTVRCRCRLAVHPETQASAFGSQDASRAAFSDPRLTAAGEHTGAMIALVPTEDDAARLALDGGEPAEELHCTLWFLGKGADWTDDQRNELTGLVRARAATLPGPVRAHAFGVNHWNPSSEDPAWVWAVSDDREPGDEAASLREARDVLAADALESTHDRPETPHQHSPWVAHTTACYSPDTWPLEPMTERLGPVTYDRVRVAFAGEYTDIPLGSQQEEEAMPELAQAATVVAEPITTRAWSTPGDTAIAFENEETGDGRVFAPGSLYWDRDPLPLQYADEMGMGHEGAELCGAINTVMRDGNRITAAGVLYLNRYAGMDAVMLLEQEAPLGVSVDLDDVDIEFVDKKMDPEDADWLFASAHLAQASVLCMDDGSVMLSGASRAEWTASAGGHMARNRFDLQLITGPGGSVDAATIRSAFAGSGVLTAAAGDPDDPESGLVVHAERAGDFLVRITRARVRGATLVAMPAYNRARIALDPMEETAAASAPVDAASGDVYERVVGYVVTSPVAVGARDVANALGIGMEAARRHLGRAAKNGGLVRLAPGLYVGPSTLPEGEVTAAMSGNLDLPVHDEQDADWDGDKARSRMLEWATDDEGNVDPEKLGSGFLYRDEDADPSTASAYKLPFADVFSRDGSERLEIVANAVYTIASVLQGGMGGVDIPDDEQDKLRSRVEDLYARLAKAYGDDSITPPWADEETASLGLPLEIEASAWTAMQQMPPMPADWFREPTAEELPPGSGGVHYKDGRVYGWVARSGEPHAGYPGKQLTIDKLARQGLDTTHFLRARFRLDDGTTARVGAMTMNVGHHRDGAECETDVCQFDDTRTVGAIVTVGLSEGGLWFSGAAAPWLSEWDRVVFQACQPSYHLKQDRGGTWQLRAVLTVPVPGHSSPLVAAVHAVAERAELALAASAAGLLAAPDSLSGQDQDTVRTLSGPCSVQAADLPGQRPDTVSGQGGGGGVDELAAALLTDSFVDRLLDAMAAREAVRRAEVEALAASLAATPEAITASAAPKGNS
ncbi:phage minor head protein [Streptomyces sp. NPDC001698]|uniref:phage minor head protein n=1 Tax=Streptomyces sp. NPDC001698 TaxID=3364601 RepID=UPI0036901818